MFLPTSVRVRALFGPLAALLILAGIIGLARMVPDYSQVHQTVSEIGEMDSPARWPFALLLSCVGVFVLVFSSALHSITVAHRTSRVGAYLTGFMALPAIGLGIFAYPHPLHNVCGLLELVGTQAPFALAMSWRRDRALAPLVTTSWIFSALVWVAIIANLTTFMRRSGLGLAWRRSTG